MMSNFRFSRPAQCIQMHARNSRANLGHINSPLPLGSAQRIIMDDTGIVHGYYGGLRRKARDKPSPEYRGTENAVSMHRAFVQREKQRGQMDNRKMTVACLHATAGAEQLQHAFVGAEHDGSARDDTEHVRDQTAV